jgi:hypothetical protein
MGTRKKANMPTAKLDSLIAKLEGKKSQVTMGNIREVRKIIDNLIINNKQVRARYALFFKVS